MSNNSDDIGWFTKLLLQQLVVGMMLLLLGAMIAPFALPSIRKMVTQKYSEYKHKDALIAQEMMIWKIITFGLMILGWAFFFFAQSQY
jgi:hypothetical protein